MNTALTAELYAICVYTQLADPACDGGDSQRRRGLPIHRDHVHPGKIFLALKRKAFRALRGCCKKHSQSYLPPPLTNSSDCLKTSRSFS